MQMTINLKTDGRDKIRMKIAFKFKTEIQF